jgi:hypothetical protein
VASQALYVRLGTDNVVFFDTPIFGTYTKKYTALVTDAAGNPAPDGTQVRFVLRPANLSLPSFFKGFYTWDALNKLWVQTVTASCKNEDLNLNGTLDGAGTLLTEDKNGNGSLDPVGVATVNATATTANGFAIAAITYSKQWANWVQDDLEARAGTVGNDPPSVVTLVLPGVATDYTTATIAPPGQPSPYGWGGGVNLCNNTQ